MDDIFLLLILASIIALIVGIVRPSVFSRLLHSYATRRGNTIVFGLATMAFFVLFGITMHPVPKTTQNYQLPGQTAPTSEQAELHTEAVSYEILQSEDISIEALGNKLLSEFTAQELSTLPMNKKVIFWIVVSPEIKRSQIDATVQRIISDIRSNDSEIDEILVFLYSDDELVNGMYDVATATWAPGGKLGGVTAEIAESNDRSSYRISLEINQSLESYLQERAFSEEKFGFTEVERRQIFKELVSAEERARVEAERKFPTDAFKPDFEQENVMRNIDEERQSSETYTTEVRAKYGITEDTENRITMEAFREHWPLN